jgi:hypothetical protein
MSHISTAISRDSRNITMKQTLNNMSGVIAAAATKISRAPDVAADELDEACAGLIRVIKSLKPGFDFGVTVGAANAKDDPEVKATFDALRKENAGLYEELNKLRVVNFELAATSAAAAETQPTIDIPVTVEPPAETEASTADVPVVPRPRGRRKAAEGPPVE